MSEPACPKCERTPLRLEPSTVGIEMSVCFSCMLLCYSHQENYTIKMKPLHGLKRVAANDWKIGTNKQLTKNQLWEEELERLYAIWIGIKLLEDEAK